MTIFSLYDHLPHKKSNKLSEIYCALRHNCKVAIADVYKLTERKFWLGKARSMPRWPSVRRKLPAAAQHNTRRIDVSDGSGISRSISFWQNNPNFVLWNTTIGHYMHLWQPHTQKQHVSTAWVNTMWRHCRGTYGDFSVEHGLAKRSPAEHADRHVGGRLRAVAGCSTAIHADSSNPDENYV